jgi:hypothetical protein
METFWHCARDRGRSALCARVASPALAAHGIAGKPTALLYVSVKCTFSPPVHPPLLARLQVQHAGEGRRRVHHEVF